MSNPQENVEQPQQVTPTVEQEELEIIEAPDTEGDQLPEIQETPKVFDPKTDRVDFSTPEQEAKFNYVYKQVKMSDARNAMLTELLQTQQQQLDEIKSRFNTTDSAQAESFLLQKIKSARDSGNDVAEIAAINELVEFKADKKINSIQKPTPQQTVTQPDPAVNYVANVMNERDSSGQPVRPWLQEGSPEFENSIQLLETTIGPKYSGDPLYLEKSLAELDQIMRAKMTTTNNKPPSPQARVPNPMQGSNLTNVSKKPTIKMTRQEIDIAKKLGVDPKKYAARRDEIAAKGKK